jgi:hypothetical protein
MSLERWMDDATTKLTSILSVRKREKDCDNMIVRKPKN